VIYTSRIAAGVGMTEIERLLARARRMNRQRDITGALMICQGRFVQVLEGRSDAVELVMDAITRDSRHHAVEVLGREFILKRQFSGWDMALLVHPTCPDSLGLVLSGVAAPTQLLDEIVQMLVDAGTVPFR